MSAMTALISVIIPIYNAKGYLEVCLDSVISQTYRNLEVLLIDDGSTDGSGAICDHYAFLDGRIKVVHQENHGQAAARNVGLKLAKGEYIIFIDSDDYVNIQFVEKLYRLVDEYQADIGICDYIRTDEKPSKVDYKNPQIRVLQSEDMLEHWHGNDVRIETVPWNKIYHHSVFRGKEGLILFPEGMIFEDVYIIHRFIENSNKCIVTSEKLYTYVIRENSTKQSKVSSKKVMDCLNAQKERMIFFRERNYEDAWKRLFIGAMKTRMLYYCLSGSSEDGIRAILRESFLEDYREAIHSRYCSAVMKLIFIGFRFCPWIFNFAVHFTGNIFE